MEKGYIHIYTGNGKGKTTAAFGLAVRAALSGKKVFIGQFVKNMEYNETKIKDYLSNIEIKQLGRGCFIYEDPEEIGRQASVFQSSPVTLDVGYWRLSRDRSQLQYHRIL